MKKIREWMHGKGRTTVMIVVALIAIGIILHYFIVERGGYIGSNRPNPTTSPKSREELNIGGDRIGPLATPKKEKKSNHKISQEKKASVQLGFAGDICFDSSCAVMKHMEKKGGLDKVISPSLIRKMNDYDAMILNNEFSISSRGSKMSGKAYTFRAEPSSVKYLKKLGVDVVGLANNHVFDYGKSAFLDTLSFLKKAQIKTMGAGKNSKEAQKPVYLKIQGKKIAIVAATRAEKYVLTPEAQKSTPGVFRTYNDNAYVKAIKKAKKKADYVIAYVHWGTEYSTKLEEAQVNQAKDFINAGANAVVGAHPHCMQGIGYYKGAPIFYSLGNLWFNEKELYTTVLELNFSKNGQLTAKMQPCLQKGKETRLLTKKKEIKKFTSYINAISTNARLDANCNIEKK